MKYFQSILINFAAPKMFSFAFSIAKRFLNEYTLSKIQIFKADPRKWKPAILELVPVDQMPAHFGGTLKDPDGNPKLVTKVTNNIVNILSTTDYALLDFCIINIYVHTFRFVKVEKYQRKCTSTK